MLTGYHNHSVFSDGENTPEEMVAAAAAAGFREFGLSDHLVLPPGPGYGAESWSMTPDSLSRYVDEVLRLKTKYDRPGFKVRLGAEVDFFEENALETAALLRRYPFDYWIGAVHYCGTFPLDHSAYDWETRSQEEIDGIWRRYWIKMRNMAASGLYDFAAHLDLPKKYGFRAREPQDGLVDALFAELHRRRMPIEINTAGQDKPCAAFYPSAPLLRKAADLDLPILINADAHACTQIRRYFPQAEECLRNLGNPRIVSIQRHQLDLAPRPAVRS